MDRMAFLSYALTPRTYDSSVYGPMTARPATGKDKAAARRFGTEKNEKGEPEFSNEKFEAALVMLCSIDPKFEVQDLDGIMNQSAGEVNAYANLIVKALPNPSSKTSTTS